MGWEDPFQRIGRISGRGAGAIDRVFTVVGQKIIVGQVIKRGHIGLISAEIGGDPHVSVGNQLDGVA